jgi:hypothetical protein
MFKTFVVMALLAMALKPAVQIYDCFDWDHEVEDIVRCAAK